jgi:hypothetical protein
MPFALDIGMQEMQASKNTSQFVAGLEYPASKNSILAAARKASVGPTVQDALSKLPDREYADAEDLTQALNASS